MKTNELMLGDIITFKDSVEIDETPVPVKVITLWRQRYGHENEALVKIGDTEICDIVTIDDDFVGYPLTPEILKKNGFELRQGVWILAEELWRIYIQYKDGKWSIDARNEISSKDEKGRADLASFCRDWAENFFVHELQHALRLCGIEKEIVL